MVICLCGYTQNDCDKFKTGEFYTDTPVMGRTFITRTDSLQIEINESSGFHYVLKVDWISNCEYTLELIENKSTNPKFQSPTDQFFLNVRITNTTDKSYQNSASLNGGEYKYLGTIVKAGN